MIESIAVVSDVPSRERDFEYQIRTG